MKNNQQQQSVEYDIILRIKGQEEIKMTGSADEKFFKQLAKVKGVEELDDEDFLNKVEELINEDTLLLIRNIRTRNNFAKIEEIILKYKK